MFGFHTKKKLLKKIADLKIHVAADAKRMDDMVSYHKSQIAIREGEKYVLSNRVSNLSNDILKKDSAIEMWMEKSKADQTKIDIKESEIGILKTGIKDRDKSIMNLWNAITEKDVTIKKLEVKVIELQKPVKNDVISKAIARTYVRVRKENDSIPIKNAKRNAIDVDDSGNIIFQERIFKNRKTTAKMLAYYDRGKTKKKVSKK